MRVAMVGAGARAQSQLAALAASGAGTPVALWDRNPDRARIVAERFGIPSTFSGIAEMVAATTPDLVNVVTHPSHRVGPIREALAGGARALLIEKPLALTAAELDAIDALGSQAFIAVNTQYPWMSHWVRFRERIAELGAIEAITASTATGVLDQGPHGLSLALSAARAAGLPDPHFVSATVSGTDEYGGVQIPADLRAEFGLGDARLTLLAGPSAPRVPGESVIWFQQQVEIEGSTGRLWSSLNQGWRWTTTPGTETGTTDWPRDDAQSQGQLFTDLAAALADPALQDTFPTRLAVASAQARLILEAIRQRTTSD